MTTSKSFYAFDNMYGDGTIGTDGYRIGRVYRFDTKAERDAWVDDDEYRGGRLHHEAIDAAEARREMAHRVAGTTGWMSMGKLWAEYDLEVSL